MVDNTNADPETRTAWTTLAKKFGVPCRLVHFTAPSKLCEHNNTVRALASGELVSAAKSPEAICSSINRVKDESGESNITTKDGVQLICKQISGTKT